LDHFRVRLHGKIISLFLQSHREFLHEGANAVENYLGFFFRTLVASVRNVVAPCILEEHELHRRTRKKLLLVLPVRRTVLIIRYIANRLLDPFYDVCQFWRSDGTEK
jgi:hypothetical protein